MNRQIHKCIVYADGGQVSAATFQNNKYCPIKDDGNEKIQLRKNFWEWWKEKMEYVEGDMVDICIISDQKYPELELTDFSNIVSEGETFWKEANIRSFLEVIVNYNKITLKSENGFEMKVLKEKTMFGGDVNKEKIFYTNMKFERKKNTANKKTKDNGEVSDENTTEFIQYWRNLKETQKGNY